MKTDINTIKMCEHKSPNYIICEFVEKNKLKENTIIAGVYKGDYVQVSEPLDKPKRVTHYFGIYNQEAKLKLLNKSEHDIVSIRTFDGIMEELCVFNGSDFDQETASRILRELLFKCETDITPDGERKIKPSFFTNVPSTYTYTKKFESTKGGSAQAVYKDTPSHNIGGKPANATAQITSVKSNSYAPVKVNDYSDNTYTYKRTQTTTTTQTKQVSVIKRTTEKPSKEDLKVMLDKVIGLKSGVVTVSPKSFEAIDGKEVDNKTENGNESIDSSYLDDYNIYTHPCLI